MQNPIVTTAMSGVNPLLQQLEPTQGMAASTVTTTASVGAQITQQKRRPLHEVTCFKVRLKLCHFILTILFSTSVETRGTMLMR